jgi:PAS domain S-box-containing protein
VNQLRKFLGRWLFPLLIGIAYWVFDAVIDYFNPGTPSRPTTFVQALLADWHSMDIVFRVIMTILCSCGAAYYERVMQKVQKLEKLLYLNEYAVERTKAFALLWTDENGNLIKANQYAAERLGYTKAELLSRTIFDITPSHTLEKWKQLLSQLKEKGSLSYATMQRKKDGTSIDAIVYLQYLKTKTDQYQFAFVCDAFHCPVPNSRHPISPCGKPVLPTFETLVPS